MLELELRYSNLQMQIVNNTNEKNNATYDLNKLTEKYKNSTPTDDDQITIDTLSKKLKELDTNDTSLTSLSEQMQSEITKEKAKLDSLYNKVANK